MEVKFTIIDHFSPFINDVNHSLVKVCWNLDVTGERSEYEIHGLA